MKFLFACLFLIINLFASNELKNSLALSKEELQYLEQHKTITFTGDPNWLPYEAFDKDGNYTGIVSDHLKVLEKSYGITFNKIVPKTWDDAINIAMEGRADIISGDTADKILILLILFVLGVLFLLYRQYAIDKYSKRIEDKNIKIKKLNERMELALLGNSDAVWDWSILANEIYYSPRWKEMLGYSDDELPNEFSVWEERMHKDDKDEVLADVQMNITGNSDYMDSVLRLKHKDGHWIWVQCRAKAIFDNNGKAIRMIGTNTDVTTEKEIEQELENSNYNLQQYMDAIDKIDIGLFVVDEDFKVRYMNNTMIKWFGNQTGKICYSSVANLNEPCPYCRLHEVIYENKKVAYGPTTPDGQSFDIIATSVKNLDGTTSKMEVIRNITEQKVAQQQLLDEKEKLNHQAHHDALTRLPNRVLFNDRLSKAIEKAKRNKSKVALLFIDLDHFKEINDSLGHDVGDEVLKTVTSKLKDTIREEDSLSRLGGDEFTVILEELAQAHDASLIANKILDILSKPIRINDNTLYVFSSIGISIYPDDGLSAQNLLKFADSAMYKAKDEGRNNYQYYDSTMTKLALERVVMEANLRNALEKEEFVVYYQPQVNGTTDELVGMEALVRWQHPTMGIVLPDQFIPLAESTGLMLELDRFVMKTAMIQLSKWHKEGLNPGVLAMNLSVKQLQQKNFIQTLENLIEETECKSQWIELEVTEGQIMNNPEESIKTLQAISDIGIELAIDDFGTGYSSLAYLKKLPIDKLKIDIEFIKDLPDDEEDSAITKAVIALGQSLNLKTIAEGVETKEQRDFVVQNGCENIQGYFYSKPISANEMEVILSKELSS